jgi:hypothetical protein
MQMLSLSCATLSKRSHLTCQLCWFRASYILWSVSAPSLLLNNFLLTPNPNNNLICHSLCGAVCICCLAPYCTLRPRKSQRLSLRGHCYRRIRSNTNNYWHTYDRLNCLGLKCDDIGRHVLADEVYPECQDEGEGRRQPSNRWIPNNRTMATTTTHPPHGHTQLFKLIQPSSCPPPPFHRISNK